MMSNYTQTKKCIKVFKKFDTKKEKNPDWNIIEGSVFRSLCFQKPVQLISFTCSTTNTQFMFDQKNPEKYVSTDPKRNNLAENLSTLTDLYLELTQNGIPLQIFILIGNTDPFYIYSQEAKKFPNIGEKMLLTRFNRKWKTYVINLKNWLKKKSPGLKTDVISWYELEQKWNIQTRQSFRKLFQTTYKNIYKYFSKQELNWEFQKLDTSFGYGQYYYGAKKPNKRILNDWVNRKFAEYAVQGLWIKQIWPDGILLQNEKPTDLRYKMYQPLIKAFFNTRLANLYPYGVDNSEYS